MGTKKNETLAIKKTKEGNIEMNNRANATSFKKGHLGLRGKKNHMWKENDICLASLHKRIYVRLGKASVCVLCFCNDAKKYEWANISRKYKSNISDWTSLCTSCHRKYDGHDNKMIITRKKRKMGLMK